MVMQGDEARDAMPAVVTYAAAPGSVELREVPALEAVVQKAVTIYGSFSHNCAVWERVIAMMAGGQLDVRPSISAQLPLEAWRDAFEGKHRGPYIKAVLRPDGAAG